MKKPLTIFASALTLFLFSSLMTQVQAEGLFEQTKAYFDEREAELQNKPFEGERADQLKDAAKKMYNSGNYRDVMGVCVKGAKRAALFAGLGAALFNYKGIPITFAPRGTEPESAPDEQAIKALVSIGLEYDPNNQEATFGGQEGWTVDLEPKSPSVPPSEDENVEEALAVLLAGDDGIPGQLPQGIEQTSLIHKDPAEQEDDQERAFRELMDQLADELLYIAKEIQALKEAVEGNASASAE